MPPYRALAERFWEKVERGEGCWLWRGAGRGTEHGTIRLARHGRMAGAHRIAWELTNGPIPDGLFVCHRCDNPRCVTPDHLFLGTPADNAADMAKKGRSGRTQHPEAYASLVGVTNPSARLTPDAVADIRQRYAAGGITQQALANEYGITQQSVWAVVHGKTWSLGL